MKLWTRITLASTLLWVLVLMTALSACTSLTANVEHVSHPMAGWPFGPADEEAALNTVNISLRKDYDNGVFIEHSIGYKFATKEYDFVGPKVAYTGRIGITLWSKDRAIH